MARRQEKEKKQKPIRYFDYSLLFLIIFLLCFGLVMLYSTSSYYGSTRFGDTAYYLKKQLFATSLGIIAMIIVSRIPYRFWMRVSGLAYLMAFGLCTAVIFIGTEAKGQARWIYIGPLSFQPSEFAKLAVIIFLRRSSIRRRSRWGILRRWSRSWRSCFPSSGWSHTIT